MENIIEVKNFTKKYDKFVAVDNISFEVKKGELFSFLGPNGAGKSTTINVLTTFLTKESGEINICGFKLGQKDDEIRSKIGVVFQESLLDDLLTVRENLKIRGSFYKTPSLDEKINELAKLMKLEEFIDKPYGKLSGGQKRRSDIARALLNEPEILFLDEPTTGLDPQTRTIVWNIIKKLQSDKNTTVFLTTHYMEEAAQSDRVAIIDYGKIVAYDTPEQLRLKYSNDVLKIVPKDIAKMKKKLNKKDKIKGDMVIIDLKSSMDALSIIEKYKDDIKGFEVIRGTMDDVFINITGREIKGE